MAESTVRIGIYANDKASATIKSVEGGLRGIATQAKSSILTGVGLGAGITAFNMLGNAAGAAADFIGESIRSATNLAESVSKVGVVFGDSADEIMDWSEDSATAFGQSQQAALEAAGTYGNLFQAFGIGREESQKMSMALVELAADLASFNNTTVDDALVALRSGLAGETEPLKRFGIALNDARMRSVLAAQGVRDLGATLTAEQKAIAAYTIIMQDSSLAQGDFARTADGAANQARILQAQVDDLQADLGTGLMPVWRDLLQIGNDFVGQLSAVGDVASAVGTEDAVVLAEAIRDLTGGMLDFTEEAKAAVSSGQTTANNWIAMGEAASDATVEVEKHGFSYGVMADRLKASLEEAKKNAKLGLDELVDELVGAQTGWEKAWDDYLGIMENDLDAATEIAQLQGMLTGQELANGLNSTDPERRAAAEAMKATIEERLFALRNNVPAIATATGTNYANALAATKTQVYLAAHTLRENASAPLTGPIRQAAGWGSSIGAEFARGLKSQLNAVYAAAESLASQVSGQLAPWHSPPRFGPLKDLDTDAQELGQLWAENLGKGIGNSWMPNVELGARQLNAIAGPMGMMGAAPNGNIELNVYLDGEQITAAVERRRYYGTPTTALVPRG